LLLACKALQGGRAWREGDDEQPFRAKPRLRSAGKGAAACRIQFRNASRRDCRDELASQFSVPAPSCFYYAPVLILNLARLRSECELIQPSCVIAGSPLACDTPDRRVGSRARQVHTLPSNDRLRTSIAV
jgi:hypothetical protein